MGRSRCEVAGWLVVMAAWTGAGPVGCGGSSEEPPAPPAGDSVPTPAEGPLSAEQRAAANRAVGLMGRYDYEAAAALLETLLADRPDWIDGRVNLAIAVMNRQMDGDEQRALELARAVLAAAPEHPRALYVAGLLELRSGEMASAAERLDRVAAMDASDPYVAYFHGQAIEPQSPERALAEYERALALDPAQRSAAYRAASVLRRLGRTDEARERLELFQRLEGNPQARSAEFVYTRMGEKAELVPAGPDITAAAIAPRPEGPLFEPPRAILASAADGGEPAPVVLAADRPAPAIVAADLDGDGRTDLLVPGAGPELPDGSRGMLVLMRDGDDWRIDAAGPLATVGGVRTVLVGDLDDDGRSDAYLLRRGGNVLLMSDPEAPGGWRDATERSATAGGKFDSVDGAMVDADHDGDLDIIVVNADGPDELFSHDGDGVYRSLGATAGLAASTDGSRSVIVDDIDADRDLDIIIVRDEGALVLRNDRLWAWEPSTAFASLGAAPILGAVSADADADGRAEIMALGLDGAVRRWSAEEDWSDLPPTAADLDAGPTEPPAPFAVLDVDGDAIADLLWIDADGRPLVLMTPDAYGKHTRLVLGPSAARFAVVPSDTGRGPAVVVARPGEALQWHEAGPGRHEFLAVEVRGRTDAANSLRSNAAGIGTRYAARVGDLWQAGRFVRGTSGPGQGDLVRYIGLAGRERADFIELVWPDGVFQSEVHGAADPGGEPVSLASGRIVIQETQRQLSSCPVVFAWDGSEWRFISDVLGVGGMGYLLEPGVFAPPRPRERFLMPEGLPAPRDGRLVIKLHEPMEEACYLDHAAFDAWDLPPGWDLVPDERMDLAAPAATGEPRFFRVTEERVVVAARNDRGQEVAETLRHVDDVAAPVPPVDRRYLGRLESEHVLHLWFDRPLPSAADGSGVPTLIADGWVEYPYSQTNFAAWQAGLEWQPPIVEALAPDGRWIVVSDRAAYPAGMPRRMSLPLPAMPEGVRELRIRTNLECYWDRISVAPTVSAEQVEPAPVHRRLDPVAATLRRSGFPARTTAPQRRPVYDYALRRPFADMRAQRGFYTAEGDVLELISAIDDAVAVFGPGEEVTVEVLEPPAAPEGWTRRLVLDVAGWCKDMDLFTGDGDTVDPMPTRSGGPPATATVDLHDRTRTRFRSGS